MSPLVTSIIAAQSPGSTVTCRCRDLGPSNSAKYTDCHVPSATRPPSMGSVTLVPDQCGLEVRVAVAFDVPPAGDLRRDAAQPRDQVRHDVRVGVLVDEDPRRCVRRSHDDHPCRDARIGDRSRDDTGDVEQFFSAGGADVVAHARPLSLMWQAYHGYHRTAAGVTRRLLNSGGDRGSRSHRKPGRRSAVQPARHSAEAARRGARYRMAAPYLDRPARGDVDPARARGYRAAAPAHARPHEEPARVPRQLR